LKIAIHVECDSLDEALTFLTTRMAGPVAPVRETPPPQPHPAPSPRPVTAGPAPVDSPGEAPRAGSIRDRLLTIIAEGNFDLRTAARKLHPTVPIDVATNRVHAALSSLQKLGLVRRGPNREWLHINAPEPAKLREAPRPHVERPPAPPDVPASSAPSVRDYSDLIVEAFRKDPMYRVPLLAERMFGSRTGDTVAKARKLIEQLVADGRLRRIGAASFVPAGVALGRAAS
jgi:hypothetical protein